MSIEELMAWPNGCLTKVKHLKIKPQIDWSQGCQNIIKKCLLNKQRKSNEIWESLQKISKVVICKTSRMLGSTMEGSSITLICLDQWPGTHMSTKFHITPWKFLEKWESQDYRLTLSCTVKEIHLAWIITEKGSWIIIDQGLMIILNMLEIVIVMLVDELL